MMVMSHGFTDPTLYAVSRHSIPYFFAYSHAKASLITVALLVEDQQIFGANKDSLFLHPKIISPR